MDQAFIELLKREIEGEVHIDDVSRNIYSVDASIYEIEPGAIVVPKSKNDLIKAVQIAADHNVSITPRGAATGITGGCLGAGLIIDTSKYLNRIVEINVKEGFAVCEPGVVQDDLNRALLPFGYRLGPDTSTGNRATIGGMAANNAAGAHSLKYGKMVDHVLAIEAITGSGDTIHFYQVDKEEYDNKCRLNNHEGEIYRTVRDVQENYHSEIKNRFPNIPRRVSGYNLDELIKPGDINLAKLLVGSEGTLAIMSEIKVSIVPKLETTEVILIYFDDLIHAFEVIPEILKLHPVAIELIDDTIIVAGKEAPALRGKLEWLRRVPKALLVVEFETSQKHDIKEDLSWIPSADIQEIKDQSEISNIWLLRKSGLGVLLSKRSYSRAIAFIEDLSIAPDRLAPFMKEFCQYLKENGKEAGIYGHAGSGCMHIRPYVDLRDSNEIELMFKMMEEVSSLVQKYHGALSGEHGDGLIRSWLNKKMFGDNLTTAFEEIKRAFDPKLILNPGKIVFPADPTKNLRLSPSSILETPKTFLNFENEGGFDLAVDLCNGNGLCRKKEGTMCPSFQVDNDEYHSTRARAQTLRGMIHGKLPLENLASKDLHDVLDLCIMCKGCKTECPSQVDMAKMKAEALYQYQEKWGLKIRDYLFGYIGEVNRALSILPRFSNWMQNSFFGKAVLSSLGITNKRQLPTLAIQRFSVWFKGFEQPKSEKRVVLFNDTFNEFNSPEIGQAAVRVLNKLGYEVIVPPWKCCGRPMISKGLLPAAREQAEGVISLLINYANDGLSIVGLEPSCLLSIKDDYPDLVSSEEVETLKRKCVTFDEFVENHEIKNRENRQYRVLVHGHCHQKALVGMKPTLNVLNSISGVMAEEIQSGCCGMAGSFGYEKEHFDFSMKIGNLKLFPAIKKANEAIIIVGDGTSCRHQIVDGTGRQAIHLAEFLDRIL